MHFRCILSAFWVHLECCGCILGAFLGAFGVHFESCGWILGCRVQCGVGLGSIGVHIGCRGAWVQLEFLVYFGVHFGYILGWHLG